MQGVDQDFEIVLAKQVDSASKEFRSGTLIAVGPIAQVLVDAIEEHASLLHYQHGSILPEGLAIVQRDTSHANGGLCIVVTRQRAQKGGLSRGSGPEQNSDASLRDHKIDIIQDWAIVVGHMKM
jgi:hypothetical protein